MFTAVEGMSQDEIDELAPTQNALSLLEVNSRPVIKELPTFFLADFVQDVQHTEKSPKNILNLRKATYVRK